APEHAGVEQHQRGGDVGAVGKTHGDDARGVELVVRGRRPDERGQLPGAKRQVLDVEDAFGETTEEARRPLLEDLSARAENGRARREVAERHHVVLVAAGAVQQQERRRAGRRGRLEHMMEAEIRHYATGIVSGGSTRSICGREASNHGGSTSDSPRCAGSSSTAKPGPSVAISNRTPPGSLK